MVLMTIEMLAAGRDSRGAMTPSSRIPVCVLDGLRLDLKCPRSGVNARRGSESFPSPKLFPLLIYVAQFDGVYMSSPYQRF